MNVILLNKSSILLSINVIAVSAISLSTGWWIAITGVLCVNASITGKPKSSYKVGHT